MMTSFCEDFEGGRMITLRHRIEYGLPSIKVRMVGHFNLPPSNIMHVRNG